MRADKAERSSTLAAAYLRGRLGIVERKRVIDFVGKQRLIIPTNLLFDNKYFCQPFTENAAAWRKIFWVKDPGFCRRTGTPI
jgi:hypothetical protein